MDTAGLALIITAISGAILGVATLLNNRRTSKITTRVDDTNVAFAVLNSTIQTISNENKRVNTELDEVRKEHEACETVRKELEQIVGKQATEITNLKKAVEDLSTLVQKKKV